MDQCGRYSTTQSHVFLSRASKKFGVERVLMFFYLLANLRVRAGNCVHHRIYTDLGYERSAVQDML